jgi:hypothetical protein
LQRGARVVACATQHFFAPLADLLWEWTEK